MLISIRCLSRLESTIGVLVNRCCSSAYIILPASKMILYCCMLVPLEVIHLSSIFSLNSVNPSRDNCFWIARCFSVASSCPKSKKEKALFAHPYYPFLVGLYKSKVMLFLSMKTLQKLSLCQGKDKLGGLRLSSLLLASNNFLS